MTPLPAASRGTYLLENHWCSKTAALPLTVQEHWQPAHSQTTQAGPHWPITLMRMQTKPETCLMTTLLMASLTLPPPLWTIPLARTWTWVCPLTLIWSSLTVTIHPGLCTAPSNSTDTPTAFATSSCSAQLICRSRSRAPTSWSLWLVWQNQAQSRDSWQLAAVLAHSKYSHNFYLRERLRRI